jgi:hypothetical protein
LATSDVSVEMFDDGRRVFKSETVPGNKLLSLCNSDHNPALPRATY